MRSSDIDPVVRRGVPRNRRACAELAAEPAFTRGEVLAARAASRATHVVTPHAA